MRRAARTDDNQPEIVDAARGVGCTVWITSGLGNGGPDLVIGCPRTRTNYLVEVKDGSKPPSAQALTPKEQEFMRTWQGRYAVVSSVAELYQLLGVHA